MDWINADAAQHLIEDHTMYLVKTNGSEWRDGDLFIWPGVMVKNRMRPEIVRGRPTHISIITKPPE